MGPVNSNIIVEKKTKKKKEEKTLESYKPLFVGPIWDLQIVRKKNPKS